MQIYRQILPPLTNCSLKNDKKYVLKSWQYLKNNGAGGLLLIFFRKRRKFAVELPTGMQCVVLVVVGSWCWYAIFWCAAQCVSIDSMRSALHVSRDYVQQPCQPCVIRDRFKHSGTVSNYVPGVGEGTQCGTQVHPFWGHPPEMLHTGPKY